MKQLFNLIRQHRFYTAICVIGTAVTVAFVMVVVMVYDFRTANVAPETRRSRTMYHDGTLLCAMTAPVAWVIRGSDRWLFTPYMTVCRA